MVDVPMQPWVASQRSPLPMVVLGAGTVLSLLLTIALQLAFWARNSLQLASISEARFRAIFANASVGITVVDDHGRVLQSNEHLQQMFGFSEEQMHAKSFTEFVHPLDLDRTWKTYQELLAGKMNAYQIELRSLRADGQTIWISVACSALPDSRNAKLAIGMVTDITERKSAEKRLALQHQITRILSEDAATTETVELILQCKCELFDWDFGDVWAFGAKDGTVLRPLTFWHAPSLNAADFVIATQQAIFSKGEGLPGRVWESKQATWIEDLRIDTNFRRGEEARKCDLNSAFGFPIQFQNEFYGVMEFFCREIRKPDQGLLEMMESLGTQLGQFFQRKASEQVMRDTLALQQAILDNADRSIISISPDGMIQVFNHAAERMLGYTAEEMVGKQTPALIHDPGEIRARAKELTKELGRVVKPDFEVFIAKPALGAGEEREWIYVRKDGSRFPALLTVTACRDSKGNITGYSKIANDISEQQRVGRRIAQGQTCGGEREQGQKRVPGQYEPRNPHPDEWHRWYDRTSAGDAT